jgi:endonuclease/exonuclease/phosphatase family metal-dependent hydrolase
VTITSARCCTLYVAAARALSLNIPHAPTAGMSAKADPGCFQVVRGACHGIDLTSTHLSLNDKSRWRQASAAASVLQQRRARLQLPQARAAAACLNPNQRARCAPLRLERVYSDDGRQVITGDFNAEAASPTLQPLRGSMADVWAASLFANASSQQMASKALRAARAHAWGGDCALTHPSLTFPTWSPVKRIDMMYCSLHPLRNAVCFMSIIVSQVRAARCPWRRRPRGCRRLDRRALPPDLRPEAPLAAATAVSARAVRWSLRRWAAVTLLLAGAMTSGG